MRSRISTPTACLIALALLAGLTFACLGPDDPAEPASASAADSGMRASSPGPAGGRNAKAADGIGRPRTKFDPIPYGSSRKRQMANYSKRHYGERDWRLRRRDVRALVLHYTAGSTYSSAWSTFASNAPALGERPGVCAQFVVDKDGTIYQLTRLAVRCRHAVGINHRSIGIEMVQEAAGSPAATAEKILDRRRQAEAAVRLVAWLSRRYEIEPRDVIGHAMVNDSRFFEDRAGWRNDHSDWMPAQVRKFRKRVRKLIRKQGVRFEPKRVGFGGSVAGAELVARAFGNAASERTVLVVGEVHGDESQGRRVVRAFARGHPRLRSARVWTVASLNPDGHRSGTRGNAREVDLNRNFPVGWSDDEPPGSGYYGGPRPFSEPEARALKRLIKRLEPDLTVYYHQPWNQVLAPCQGKARPERRYAKRSGLPLKRCRGEKLPGTATRWQERRGHDAFVVELPEGRLSGVAIRRHARALAAAARR